MQRVIAIFQLLLSVLCALVALVTAVNLGFILMRPDSISVVNALVGQLLMIVFLMAASTILLRKGRHNLRSQ